MTYAPCCPRSTKTKAAAREKSSEAAAADWSGRQDLNLRPWSHTAVNHVKSELLQIFWTLRDGRAPRTPRRTGEETSSQHGDRRNRTDGHGRPRSHSEVTTRRGMTQTYALKRSGDTRATARPGPPVRGGHRLSLLPRRSPSHPRGVAKAAARERRAVPIRSATQATSDAQQRLAATAAGRCRCRCRRDRARLLRACRSRDS